MKENITLIGFMGTGKTSIGKRLAERMVRDFIDVDELIEKQIGKPISKIFEEGESKFRTLEREKIKSLKKKKKLCNLLRRRDYIKQREYGNSSANINYIFIRSFKRNNSQTYHIQWERKKTTFKSTRSFK